MSEVIPAAEPSSGGRIDDGMSEALGALRAHQPERAVRALQGVLSLSAGAGSLPHAAVLIRLSQARLAQARGAACPVEAAARAAQAHGLAHDALRRLRRAGGSGSTLEVRAARVRGEAALLLQAIASAAEPSGAGCSLGA